MPYYRDKLLSAWGNDRIFEVGKPLATSNPKIPSNARRGPGNIGHMIPNPGKCLRNQASQTFSVETNGSASQEPKYLSDKSRIAANGQRQEADAANLAQVFTSFTLTRSVGETPSGYKELRIKYGGPRGVQDFDFE